MAKFCGTCGAALNKQTGLCPVCGGAPVRGETPAEDAASRKAAPAASQRRSKFCGRCGSPTNPQTGFCPVCGAVTRYTPPEGSKNGGTSGSAEKHTKGKKRHTALWIVLAVAAVLLAAAAVLGVLVHLGVVDIPVVAQLEERLGLTPRAKVEKSHQVVREEMHGEDGEVLSYSTYEYDDAGRKVKRLIYDENGALSVYDVYGYNSKGQLTKESRYDSNDAQESYGVYEYNDKEQQVKYSRYDKAGVLDYYTINEYNAGGLLTKSLSYDRGGALYFHCVYEYNAKGQQISVLNYNENGELFVRFETVYEEDGEHIQYTRQVQLPSMQTWTNIFTYDEYGDLVRLDSYDDDNVLRSYTVYEYDTAGTPDEADGAADTAGGADGTTVSQPEEIRREVRWNCCYPDGTLQWYHIYTYDENGEETSAASYDGQGSQTGFVDTSTGASWLYSVEDGSVTQHVETSVREGNTETVTCDTYEDFWKVILYDDNDRIKELRYYSSGSLRDYDLYKYNEKGQLIRVENYDKNGEMVWYTAYELDEGRLVKSDLCYEKVPSLNSTSIYIYNEQGEMVRREDYSSSGTLQRYSTYEYAVVGMAS